MDIRKLITKLTKKESNIENLEKNILRCYIDINNIHNAFLINYYNDACDDNYIFIYNLLQEFTISKNKPFDIDLLVNIYELLIPEDEKKENGMVFTPKKIKQFIINDVFEDLQKDIMQLKICDPSCGCASFLISISKYIHDTYNIDFRYIYENIIYGVDIYDHNIAKAKLLLYLLAFENGEYLTEDINFNLLVANSLSLNFEETFTDVFSPEQNGFDLVIGNPPYVRSKNMNDEVKLSLENWSVAKSGNPDLYIVFFELGLELLNNSGKLGYISINTYLTSLNGRNLRNYLSEKGYNIKLINFKDNQIFKGVTSYTCISIINKNNLNNVIQYINSQDTNNLNNNNNVTTIDMNTLDNKQGWTLAEGDILHNINILRSFPNKLESYGIRNGVATLKNDIYIFKLHEQIGRLLYFRDKDGNMRCVEKAICKRIAKPNIIKNEHQLENKMEYIIFPYNLNDEGNFTIINENTLRNKYPNAYEYLLSYREELLTRDKGKAIDKYPQWFAFGRTQGMKNFGRKILIPYMADEPTAVLSLDEDVLFYCGYALFSDDINELKIIKSILLSNVFWYYVKNTSKYYSGGYMSLAKNYIKDFSIPDLSDEQKYQLLNLQTQDEVNRFLSNIYNINI